MSGKIKTKSPWSALFDSNANNITTAAATTATSATTTPATNVKMSATTIKTTRSTRSSSMCVVRPNTLNVTRYGQNAETKLFIGEALNAWRAKARCNVVPAERLQELFHELQFNPSEKQISEMLQTAKVFARKGSKQLNGLTFGEFCVLAADLKRFRTCNFSSSNDPHTFDPSLSLKPTPKTNSIKGNSPLKTSTTSNNLSPGHKNIRTNSSKDGQSSSAPVIVSPTEGVGPEVFLGGSCNPTTWRADVAIPTLDKLGISFYNPQVSDWTPDLIELEHRAKEKARVLFFVMDSETRASAGAIEAAHIAGQNSKQLVLVLHPYKRDQSILNEPISPQEYLDLSRNQQLLRELVTRRGLPVLDNIPSGLQRTKSILAGIRDPPSNIASILIVVRGAFDRVSNALDDEISVQQCQRALSFLGYASSLLSLDNLRQIISSQRDTQEIMRSASTSNSSTNRTPKREIRVNFDEFCVLAAYLSVLQQEIHESGCISPIKGTNLPPPPIFLANMQEGCHNRTPDESVTITTSYTKQIFRASSCTSVPDDKHSVDFYRNRDSGTSSPQPLETVKSKFIHLGKKSKISLNVEFMENGETGEESDSNDSVFSSGSSINSNFCDSFTGLEFRDVYLGGSCFLRTKWRQDYGIPYLTSKGITFHLPALHESILPSQLNLCGNMDSEKALENAINEKNNKKTTTTVGTRRKIRPLRNAQTADLEMTGINEEDMDLCSSPLALRPNLFNPALLDSSRVLLFVITNETRSLAPMTLAAHCIGLMYNVVLCVQMLPDFCIIGNDRLTPAAIKDYNRGRSYLIDLAKRQGVPVFNDLKSAMECTVEKVKACNSRNSV